MIAGINGFGRFGLHFLKYWLDRSRESGFEIKYINDDFLSIQKVYDMIIEDHSVIFNKYKVKCEVDLLTFYEPNGAVHEIQYTNFHKEEIPWLGIPDIVFECSGKNTSKNDSSYFVQGKTQQVIISATSWDADATLVYGFNHEEYNPAQQVISYGSCTVNAYVPLANYINQRYGIKNSDVNVVHNIQSYRLKDNYTLIRKFCTLEKSGINLLDFISKDNFTVNYTVIPYTGVSMIDFRFALAKTPSKAELIDDLEMAFAEGDLKNLYGIGEVDIGPEVYNCTTYSTVMIKENIRMIGNNLYLPGYFDNENSVNRFYDLVQYISVQ